MLLGWIVDPFGSVLGVVSRDDAQRLRLGFVDKWEKERRLAGLGKHSRQGALTARE